MANEDDDDRPPLDIGVISQLTEYPRARNKIPKPNPIGFIWPDKNGKLPSQKGKKNGSTQAGARRRHV